MDASFQPCRGSPSAPHWSYQIVYPGLSPVTPPPPEPPEPAPPFANTVAAVSFTGIIVANKKATIILRMAVILLLIDLYFIFSS